jgi:sulfonate transport system substrate-binding protein
LEASETGVALAAEQDYAARFEFSVDYLDDRAIARQQAIADRFHALGIIPKQVDVSAAAWRPGS